ncbi:cullin-1-like [Haemaphysalis longicornis]
MAAGGDPVKGEAIAPSEQTEPEEIWERLLEGIQQVYHCNPAGMSRGRYMELYNCVFNYASSTSWNSIKANATTGTPPDQSLMLKLYARIENFLESYLESMSADGEYLTNEPFLRFYAYSWEKYKFSSAVLDGIF